MRTLLPVLLLALVACTEETPTPAPTSPATPNPTGTPSNVDAGPDGRLTPCAPLALSGSAGDEAVWSLVSGPGSVTFADESALDTTVTVEAEGTYVLALTAGGTSDEVTLDAGFWVDDLNDSDAPGTLRTAVEGAQSCPGDHTVVFEADGVTTLGSTIQVNDPLASPDNDLVLRGSGDSALTGATRLFTLEDTHLTIEAVDLVGVVFGGDAEGGSLIRIDSGGTLDLDALAIRDNLHEDLLYTGQIFSREPGASVTLTDVIATGNTSSLHGGVLELIGEGSTLVVNGGTYGDNTALEYGGSFRVNGSAQITDASFSGNVAGRGGAIHLQSGTLTLTDTTFTDNTANELGGAVMVVDDALLTGAPTLIVDGSSFSGNLAAHGGAIRLDDQVSASIEDSVFTDNVAEASDGLSSGGAIENRGQLSLTDTQFVGNRAMGQADDGLEASGGAIDSGSLSNEHYIECTRCMFTDNTSESGGAIGSAFDDHILLVDCNFADNTAALTGGALYSIPVGHLDIVGGTLTGNTADQGGGIYFIGTNRDEPGNDANLRIDGAALSGNEAGFGGGIYSLVGDVLLTSTTITGNTATEDASVLPVGGGICNDGGWVEGGGTSGNSPDDYCNTDRTL